MLPGKAYKPEDVLQILKSRIWVLLLPFAFVAAGTALWVHRLPDQYRSETVILVVPQRVPESYVRSTVTTRIEDRLQSLVQQILSRTRLERIVRDFDLYAKERQTGIMEDVIERMRKDIGVEVLRGDSFRITYIGDNPRMVMRVTERLASLFIEENLRDREVLADDTNQFLEAQLEDARRRLLDQEKKVEIYRRAYTGQLPSQLASNLQVLQSSDAQLKSIADALDRDRERHLMLERQLADLEQQPDVAPGPSASGVLSPSQQLAKLKESLDGLKLRLKPDHPDVQRLARAIRDLEQKIAEDGGTTEEALSTREVTRRKRIDDVRVELAMLDRQMAKRQVDEERLRGDMKLYQSRVEAAPTRETEMTEMNRDYDTLQELYKSLLAKKEESKIAANLERRQIGEQFKLLDPARIAEKPFSPNRMRLNLMGMAGGLGFGLLLVALLEYRDRSFKTDEEIARVLSLPVLAVIPLMRTAAEQKWAFRRRVFVAIGFGTTVAACFAIVAYTFMH
jgi:polysaccharide chain length determinant protein (PEP-CTERM system associated)